MIEKSLPLRWPEYLAAVRTLPCALKFDGCLTSPTVPCHSNFAVHGKGKSQKAHDCFTVPGCVPCHYELDHGKRLSLEQKRAAFDRAHADSQPKVLRIVLEESNGKPRVKAPKRSALTSDKIIRRAA